jgi:hypothetical protein
MTLTYYSPRLMSPAAITAGLSPFHCTVCDSHVSKQAEKDSAFWEPVPKFRCERCGDVEGRISVLPDSSHLLDLQTAMESTWYHATCVDDWYEKIQSGSGMKKHQGKFLYIHAGTEAAARDIAEDRYFKTPAPGEKIVLNELILRPETILMERMVDDHETWEGFHSVTKKSTEAISNDGFRYVNRWESPGAISILVDARKVALVARKEIFSRSS